MTDRDIVKAQETVAGANLLNNYLTRLDTQLENALEEVGLFNPYEFNTMAMMIARLSSNPKARAILLYKCSAFMRHMLRQFPLPELTEKLVLQVQEAILGCFAFHFGGWEELLQSGGVKVLQKTHILEEDVGLSENLMSQLADVMDQEANERIPKDSWKTRRKARLEKMAKKTLEEQ